jgi:hypothetical protein
MMKLKYAVVPLIVYLGCASDPAMLGDSDEETVGRAGEALKYPNCPTTYATNRITTCNDSQSSATCNVSYAPIFDDVNLTFDEIDFDRCTWDDTSTAGGTVRQACIPAVMDGPLGCTPTRTPWLFSDSNTTARDYACTSCNNAHGNNETSCNACSVDLSDSVWHPCRYSGLTNGCHASAETH